VYIFSNSNVIISGRLLCVDTTIVDKENINAINSKALEDVDMCMKISSRRLDKYKEELIRESCHPHRLDQI
jgi:hypothetical protein